MPPTRRKSPRQQAPQTIAEAAGLLGRYAGYVTEVEQLRADADAAIAAIEAARDAAAAPLEQGAKDLFVQLRTWWAVTGIDLTEGKRKSYELAGCVLGERVTPPSLKMPGKAEDAARALIGAGLKHLCREKVEVDKPSVLKLLGGWDALAQLAESAVPEGRDDLAALMAPIETVTALGFRAVQKIEFFIDRAAPKPAPVEDVAVEQAA